MGGTFVSLANDVRARHVVERKREVAMLSPAATLGTWCVRPIGNRRTPELNHAGRSIAPMFPFAERVASAGDHGAAAYHFIVTASMLPQYFPVTPIPVTSLTVP